MTPHSSALLSSEPELAAEDTRWSGVRFDVLTRDELASQQRSVEDTVHLHRGTWWRRARMGFWQPCEPLAALDANQTGPHPLRAGIGYFHVAAPGTPSTGHFDTIVREDVPSYSTLALSSMLRSNLRRTLRHIDVRVIDRMDDLLSDGYGVYKSWRDRVQWGRDRTDVRAFDAWIRRVYAVPRRTILGAYCEGRLIAFALPYAVGTLVTPSYIASHSDYLKRLPNDALFHACLSIARQTPGIRTVDLGPVAGKPSLIQFKLKFGVVRRLPAYTWITPLVRPLVGRWAQRRSPWMAEALGWTG